MALNESWVQVASIFLANAALIVWFRAESRNDWRHMDNQVNAIRDEIKAINNEVSAIKTGVSEFHLALQRQDLEFKKQMQKQDEDFKKWIMNEDDK